MFVFESFDMYLLFRSFLVNGRQFFFVIFYNLKFLNLVKYGINKYVLDRSSRMQKVFCFGFNIRSRVRMVSFIRIKSLVNDWFIFYIYLLGLKEVINFQGYSV